jgi:hypothetical protein
MVHEVFRMVQQLELNGSEFGVGEFEANSHLVISTNMSETTLHGPADIASGIRSIYQATYDKRDAAARVFSHETGHRLMAIIGTRGGMALRSRWLAEAKAGRILTYRGYSDPQEWMAESFAALVHEPDLLRNHDPAGYSLIQMFYQKAVSK